MYSNYENYRSNSGNNINLMEGIQLLFHWLSGHECQINKVSQENILIAPHWSTFSWPRHGCTEQPKHLVVPAQLRAHL